MFHIVTVYSNGKYVSHIIARIEELDYDVLMALGRGKMYQATPGTNALKYHLPNGLMVILRTD